MSEFEPGDKVRVDDYEVTTMTIAHGPFDTPVERGVYLVSDDAGCHVIVAENQISPIPPADPRVDVVARAIAESDGEQFDVPGTRTRDSGYRGNALAVLAALDAMPQEKPATRRVLDDGGDVWERNAQGLWDCMTYDLVGCGEFTNRSYEWVDNEYGPLNDV